MKIINIKHKKELKKFRLKRFRSKNSKDKPSDYSTFFFIGQHHSVFKRVLSTRLTMSLTSAIAPKPVSPHARVLDTGPSC